MLRSTADSWATLSNERAEQTGAHKVWICSGAIEDVFRAKIVPSELFHAMILSLSVGRPSDSFLPQKPRRGAGYEAPTTLLNRAHLYIPASVLCLRCKVPTETDRSKTKTQCRELDQSTGSGLRLVLAILRWKGESLAWVNEHLPVSGSIYWTHFWERGGCFIFLSVRNEEWRAWESCLGIVRHGINRCPLDSAPQHLIVSPGIICLVLGRRYNWPVCTWGLQELSSEDGLDPLPARDLGLWERAGRHMCPWYRWSICYREIVTMCSGSQTVVRVQPVVNQMTLEIWENQTTEIYENSVVLDNYCWK